MPEKMYCPKCKKDVEPEILEWDGIVEFCPICRTGYREVSYEAHVRELEDEHAILSEFENETHPYLSRQLTMRPADDEYIAADASR